MSRTSPSSSSTSRKSKSRKTLNCCSLAVSSSVSSLVPPSSDDTPLSLTSIMSKSPHDEKITCSEEQRGYYLLCTRIIYYIMTGKWKRWGGNVEKQENEGSLQKGSWWVQLLGHTETEHLLTSPWFFSEWKKRIKKKQSEICFRSKASLYYGQRVCMNCGLVHYYNMATLQH